MSCLQLELFDTPAHEILRGEVRELEKKMGNVRRGIFQRHDELEKKYEMAREEIEKMKDALIQIQETMRNYEAALFPVSSFATGTFPGLKSISTPVSAFMMSSQASSTGLSLPQK
jgi:hypothetical protein